MHQHPHTGRASIWFALLLFFLPSVVAAKESVTQLWFEGIDSGYQELAETSRQMRSQANQYCEAPGEQTRANLEIAWRDAFLAWQKVRFVDFGPVERDNLSWQFQFWPDPKNLIGRKASQLLNTESALTSDLIADYGVAAQGFPMIEYLLFDQQLNNSKRALPEPQACALLTGVTDHVRRNAEQLANDWKEFLPHYLNTQTYRAATLKSVMNSLDILTERRLATPMGLRGNGKRSIYQADAWRSETSLASIRASLVGLRDIAMPGLHQWLTESGQVALEDQIHRQITTVIDRLDSLPSAMAPLLNDDRYAELQALYVNVAQLRQLITDQVAGKLGVVKGFNSSDGD